jgi:hypothetical protein
MKMIVGRTWNANTKPTPESALPRIPSFPKTNSEPTNASSRIRVTLAPSHPKRACPAEVLRTKRARTNWSPMPQKTVRGCTAFRSVEKA